MSVSSPHASSSAEPVSVRAIRTKAEAFELGDLSFVASGDALVSAESRGGAHVGIDASGGLVYRATEAGSDTIDVVLRAADGSLRSESVAVTVEEAETARGWSTGEHYVLPVDENGWFVYEERPDSLTFYFSPDGDAGNTGLSADDPLPANWADSEVWGRIAEITGEGGHNGAHRFMLEGGHDYGQVLPRSSGGGEDPLAPLVYGSYGEGRATIDLYSGWQDLRNIALVDLEIDGYLNDWGDARNGNIIFENVTASGELALARVENVTFHRSAIVDAYRDAPKDGSPVWEPMSNRVSGIFASETDGLLFSETIFDLNGWEPGYWDSPDGFAPADSPHPPSMFSHNLYLANNNFDVTFAESVSSRSASIGAQFRGGAFVNDSLFIDNNIAFNALGGEYYGDENFNGDGSALIDVVIADPADKRAYMIGGLQWGAGVAGDVHIEDLVAVGGAEVFDDRPIRSRGVVTVEGETVRSWGDAVERTNGAREDGDTGWDESVLEDYLATVLGAGATKEDLYAYWRVTDRDAWDPALAPEALTQAFRDALGRESGDPAGVDVRVFQANGRTGGVRWDNRMNWSGDTAPRDGEAIDIDGHWVVYGGETLAVPTLELGRGGHLVLDKGLLAVGGAIAGEDAAITIDNAGQLVATAGRIAGVAVTVESGRLAVDDLDVDGLDLQLAGGELRLDDRDPEIRIDHGDTLAIDPAARIAAEGRASLSLEGGSISARLAASGPALSFTGAGLGAASGAVSLAAGTLTLDLSAVASGVDRLDVISTDVLVMDRDDVVVDVRDALVRDWRIDVRAGTLALEREDAGTIRVDPEDWHGARTLPAGTADTLVVAGIARRDVAVSAAEGDTLLRYGDASIRIEGSDAVTVRYAPTFRLPGDVDGDGRADMILRDADGAITALRGAAAGEGLREYPEATAGERLVAAVDMSGDGAFDLVWLDEDGNARVRSSEAGGTDTVVEAPADTWVGAARRGGDGASMLWRDDGTGVVHAQGADGSVTAVARGGLDWETAVIGDLDGDGVDDIVWRHEDAGGVGVWFMDDEPTWQLLTRHAGEDWEIVDAADADGDGRDEILFWNQGGRSLGRYTLVDDRPVFDVVAVAGDAWVFSGTGDYEGDGAEDPLWRHVTDGRIGRTDMEHDGSRSWEVVATIDEGWSGDALVFA